jgi:hypothetical protein
MYFCLQCNPSDFTFQEYAVCVINTHNIDKASLSVMLEILTNKFLNKNELEDGCLLGCCAV